MNRGNSIANPAKQIEQNRADRWPIALGLLPAALFFIQVLYIALVIDPGWGDSRWEQPAWTLNLGFSRDHLWGTIPDAISQSSLCAGILGIVMSIWKLNTSWLVAGLFCIVCTPALRFHFAMATF